jgi:DNA-binding GntR family transcriptional regulator
MIIDVRSGGGAVSGSRSAPPTLTAYTAEVLRKKILDGEYPFGAWLDQQALAQELGTSLVPIREGLRQLEAEGLVRLEPRRGAFVVDLSVDAVAEIYLIREALEELATIQAVPNLGVPDLERLAAVLVEMEVATAARDFGRLLELNRTFHFIIYAQAGLPKLLTMITGLWQQSTLYRRFYTYLPARSDQALAEHQAIYAACLRRDAAAAGAAVRANVRQTVEGIVHTLHFDRPTPT